MEEINQHHIITSAGMDRATKMVPKSLLVLSILICCIALPLSKAQLNGGLGMLNLLSQLRIQGILYCTPNGNIGVNATSTPIFPNAVVQLQCGGNVVSTSTTNMSGVFSILLNPLQVVLSALISSCRLVVNTPLASCNANLPSVGGLVSNLQVIGSSIAGLLSIIDIVPSGFQFNGNIN